ncbi:MAG: N-acetyl-gamma-glutamyl-phosphate reductase [Gemmatimonadota bacterium]|nr:N-acetyl-gamma-glutamyl-phosphate reductase [Gemmatimonadota bacterium]
MNNISVGVLGASGYAGRELCELVARHPSMELAFASANSRAGEKIRVAGREVEMIATEAAPLGSADLVFSALPHGASAQWVRAAAAAGAKVVDLSADYRPGNETVPVELGCVPYGLTELYRGQVRTARVVANPGCYPTAVLIALAPLLQRGLVESGATINVSAASGVTGAGFNPKPELMFAEIAEDFRAYSVGNEHRHLNEMRATISELGTDADILFTPHLLPVARGILATITVPVTQQIANPLKLWNEMYDREPFVEVTDTMPTLRDVVRRNVVRVTAMCAANVRTPTLIVIAAIDNLVKGAAGQAVQNANVMFGFPETTGLPL